MNDMLNSADYESFVRLCRFRLLRRARTFRKRDGTVVDLSWLVVDADDMAADIAADAVLAIAADDSREVMAIVGRLIRLRLCDLVRQFQGRPSRVELRDDIPAGECPADCGDPEERVLAWLVEHGVTSVPQLIVGAAYSREDGQREAALVDAGVSVDSRGTLLKRLRATLGQAVVATRVCDALASCHPRGE